MGVPPLTIPSNLALSVAKWGDERRRDWLARLPTIVDELADRWSLRTSEPFEPGGDCSWVARVRDSTGQSLVLKVGFRHVESEHEAAGLLEWAGDGAVLLHDATEDDETLALLLEACDPGTELGRQEPEDKQDEIVAGLLRRLWRAAVRRVIRSGRCRRCATNGPTSTPPSLTRGSTQASPATACRCSATWPVHADQSVLLPPTCTAATSWPRAASPGWSSTPSPMSAIPATTSCSTCSTARSGWRPTPSGLPVGWQTWPSSTRDRVVQWLFARCVQESPDWPGMADVARRLAPALSVGQDARSGSPGNGTLPPRHAAARTAASRRPPIGQRAQVARQRLDRVGPYGGEPLLEQGGEHDGVIG